MVITNLILSSDRRKIGVNYTQHLRGKMTIHDKMTMTLLYKREEREFRKDSEAIPKNSLSLLSLPIHIHNSSLLSARQGGEAQWRVAEGSGGQVSYSYAPTLKSAISHEIASYSEHTKKY